MVQQAMRLAAYCMAVIPEVVTMGRDHPVHQKLNAILPWAVSAQKLRRQPFYVGYRFYSYGRDLAAALVGIGVSFPLLPVLTNSSAQIPLPQAMAAFPTWLKIVTGVAAIAWLCLRVFAAHEQWEKRATLARSCVQNFKRFEAKIVHVLNSADPLPVLVEINSDMNAVVDRAIQEEAWPWPGLAPGADTIGRQRAADYAGQFGRQWTELLTRERRQRGPADE
jgi:hypothetical protein